MVHDARNIFPVGDCHMTYSNSHGAAAAELARAVREKARLERTPPLASGDIPNSPAHIFYSEAFPCSS